MADARPAPGVVGVGIDAVDLDRFRAVLARRPGLARPAVHRRGAGLRRAGAGPGAPAGHPLRRQGGGHEGARGGAVVVPADRRGSGADGPRRADGGAARCGAPSLAAAAGVTRWHLSLTHTDTVALAVVVADGGGGSVRRAAGPDRRRDAGGGRRAPSPPPRSTCWSNGPATAVALAALDLLGGAYGRRVVLICGKGNNGADGRVAARLLARRGARVQVVAPGRGRRRSARHRAAGRPGGGRRLRHRLPRRLRRARGGPGRPGAGRRHPVGGGGRHRRGRRAGPWRRTAR